MKVAFLHARQDPKYAHLMLESVQRVMPGVECLHLTDADTPEIAGCTTIRRTWDHPNPMIFKMEHLYALMGEVLVLDTDVIVQQDVSGVFALPFDVGLTFRNGPIWDEHGQDITRIMPINCGVMFSRNPAFWRACLAWCGGKNPGWYADQLAVAHVAGRFNVLKLHCDNFNYTPSRADENVERRYLLHFKGKSRGLMDERLKATEHV